MRIAVLWSTVLLALTAAVAGTFVRQCAGNNAEDVINASYEKRSVEEIRRDLDARGGLTWPTTSPVTSCTRTTTSESPLDR
jgi:hypothetical protein